MMETQTATLKSNDKRAKNATTMIYLVTIGYAIVALLNIVNNIFSNEGRLFVFELQIPVEGVSGSILTFDIDVLAFVDLGFMVIVLVSAITFIMWLWQAYSNLYALGFERLYKRGWIIACWFIPILNLYLPYKIVRSMFDGLNELLLQNVNSKKNSVRVLGQDLGVWWAVCLIFMFGNNFDLKLGDLSYFGEPFSSILSIFLAALLLIAANYTIKLIEEYTHAENVLLNEEEEDDNIGFVI